MGIYRWIYNQSVTFYRSVEKQKLDAYKSDKKMEGHQRNEVDPGNINHKLTGEKEYKYSECGMFLIEILMPRRTYS
jgi:hypothetical protein